MNCDETLITSVQYFKVRLCSLVSPQNVQKVDWIYLEQESLQRAVILRDIVQQECHWTAAFSFLLAHICTKPRLCKQKHGSHQTIVQHYIKTLYPETPIQSLNVAIQLFINTKRTTIIKKSLISIKVPIYLLYYSFVSAQ